MYELNEYEVLNDREEEEECIERGLEGAIERDSWWWGLPSERSLQQMWSL